MALLDTLIAEVAGKFGLGSSATALVREVLTLVVGSPGGFGGFLNRVKSAGLGTELMSWLGNAQAAPLMHTQVEKLFGSTVLSNLAQKLGLGDSGCVHGDGLFAAEADRRSDPRRRDPDKSAARGHWLSLYAGLARRSCSWRPCREAQEPRLAMVDDWRAGSRRSRLAPDHFILRRQASDPDGASARAGDCPRASHAARACPSNRACAGSRARPGAVVARDLLHQQRKWIDPLFRRGA